MSPAPQLKPRLLLIEDDADRIILFRQWVVSTHYVLIEATTGGQAMGVVSRGGGDGIAGICLDHDLNTSPKTLQDQSTSGSNVVAAIIRHIPKTVPILVHSMNVTKGDEMFRRLLGSGFSATRIRMAILDQRRFHSWLEDVTDSWEDRFA